jgi:hypothetical protein
MVLGEEELCKEFKSKGAVFHRELTVSEYEMKEFTIIDPDGYNIAFGELLKDYKI